LMVWWLHWKTQWILVSMKTWCDTLETVTRALDLMLVPCYITFVPETPHDLQRSPATVTATQWRTTE
jgi:hypothetical protein